MHRSELLRLRPDFLDVFPDDVDDLLSSLTDAYYEWNPSQIAFVNTKLQKAIPIADYIASRRGAFENGGATRTLYPRMTD